VECWVVNGCGKYYVLGGAKFTVNNRANVTTEV
jgi:hypothetical protein